MTDHKEVEEIINSLHELNKKIRAKPEEQYISQSELGIISDLLQDTSSQVYDFKPEVLVDNDRLDELTDIMNRVSQLDFSKKAWEPDMPVNHFDYIALSLNQMQYGLKEHLGENKIGEDVFSSYPSPILVTDDKLNIVAVNDSVTQLGCNGADLIDSNLSLYIKKYLPVGEKGRRRKYVEDELVDFYSGPNSSTKVLMTVKPIYTKYKKLKNMLFALKFESSSHWTELQKMDPTAEQLSAIENVLSPLAKSILLFMQSIQSNQQFLDEMQESLNLKMGYKENPSLLDNSLVIAIKQMMESQKLVLKEFSASKPG